MPKPVRRRKFPIFRDRRPRHVLEPLEPRVLLSADLSYIALADTDVTLRVEDVGGTEMLQLVDSNDPSLILASESLSEIDGSSGFGARIDANGHAVNLTLDDSVQGGRVRGGIVFDGGDGTSSVTGPEGGATWRITGDGAGQVGDLAFIGVEQVVGGGGADTFEMTAQGRMASIVGGGGQDTLA
jgi:hypothetical protein